MIYIKPLKIYHECPICKELFENDIKFVDHIEERHEKEMAEGDKRFDGLPIDIMFMIDKI